MQTRCTLSEARRRELAVSAGVDPRTITKAFLAAHDPSLPPPRGMSGDRARSALARAGLIPTAVHGAHCAA